MESSVYIAGLSEVPHCPPRPSQGARGRHSDLQNAVYLERSDNSNLATCLGWGSVRLGSDSAAG